MTAELTTRDHVQSISHVLSDPGYRKQIAESMGYPVGHEAVNRFTRVVLRAVQEDPKVLEADRNSLYLACLRAAQDNLAPDGKEGKLVIYNTKQGDRWVNKVQWMPMVGGIRKIAASYGFDIQAHVVCENDVFEYELGDDARIIHKPAKLGQARGEIIGVYAIATNMGSGRKYREVMERYDIDRIAQASKSKDKEGNLVGPWKDYYGEQARKTVVKRLFKSLPFYDDEKLQGLISRDNEDYALGNEPTKEAVSDGGQAVVAPRSGLSVRGRMGIDQEEIDALDELVASQNNNDDID